MSFSLPARDTQKEAVNGDKWTNLESPKWPVIGPRVQCPAKKGWIVWNKCSLSVLHEAMAAKRNKIYYSQVVREGREQQKKERKNGHE